MSRVLLAVAILLLVTPPRVSAHGGQARIEVGAGEAAAGSTVSVRGVKVGEAGDVRLQLVGADGAIVELGVVQADAEGGFETSVTVPPDTAPGTWALRATVPDGDHLEAAMEVRAAATEGGEQPGQEEPLLRPMPTDGFVTPPSAAGASTLPTAPADARNAGGIMASDVLVAIAAVAGVASAAWLLRSRRSR